MQIAFYTAPQLVLYSSNSQREGRCALKNATGLTCVTAGPIACSLGRPHRLVRSLISTLMTEYDIEKRPGAYGRSCGAVCACRLKLSTARVRFHGKGFGLSQCCMCPALSIPGPATASMALTIQICISFSTHCGGALSPGKIHVPISLAWRELPRAKRCCRRGASVLFVLFVLRVHVMLTPTGQYGTVPHTVHHA